MSEFSNNNCFKEAVCIEAMRVFDSCSSQDCLEDLELSFSEQCTQDLINSASYIKSKCIEVKDVTFTIDPVPFNNGFYTVDLTYTFKVDLEVYKTGCSSPQFASGTTTFSKKVILFGSEGNTKYFTSDGQCTKAPAVTKSGCGCGCCNCSCGNPPRATVSVVEPICLDTKLAVSPNDHMCKKVLVTIGMFAIVQLQRAVPILIPAYDYCIPKRECSTNTDSPCEFFDKIQFPTNEFFPRSLDNDNCNCHSEKSSDEDITAE